MSKQRRTFSPEFKQQAACLVLDQGYSHMEASRSVGIGESVLRRWVRQLESERRGIRRGTVMPVCTSGARPPH